LTQVTILSGSVVRIWGTLENILERNEGSLSKSDRTMRVVRVELEAGKHLVGKLPSVFPQDDMTLNSLSCLTKQQTGKVLLAFASHKQSVHGFYTPA